MVGQVIGGKVGEILLREKNGKNIELGDLLVAEENEGGYLILKVFDLTYGSQIPPGVRELASGLNLEGYSTGVDFIDPKLRNYTMASVKGILRVDKGSQKIPKVLPTFFSSVRLATKEDLEFLAKPPKWPIFLGQVRSGSKVLDIDVRLDGRSFVTHHILIAATTGRGKSNLVKVMLWSALDTRKFGMFVLDAHDEYYGRDGVGLKDHPNARSALRYYSPDPPTGSNSLIINMRTLEPEHFDGIISFTDAQEDAISAYYKEFKKDWIENLVRGTVIDSAKSTPKTIAVLQRKLRRALGVYEQGGELMCDGDIFSLTSGETTVDDIVRALEECQTVIVDTSRLGDEAELLIGSIVASKLFYSYKKSKGKGLLAEKPPVGVVIEEAPRVLAADKIEEGDNIYSRIAREGRKFNVGLIAITQLASVIPTTILTNMNTKIILGNEMSSERAAIINSAAQDLSDEDRTIASLDKGEAIVSSIFAKFALPIYTPIFDDFVDDKKKKKGDDFDLSNSKLSV
ncbi:MAG: ATP-binding protein [Nitrososphaerota archaeon]|nr:ATP-binding protein [Nitrososphaerota archaeon]MDG6923246.1 ATP-binding protein [Nitrososphaerota archaeon]